MADQSSVAGVLRDVAPTPIAQLCPELAETDHRVVDGVITITWPYSIVTQTVAFTLVEHDVLLRRNRGQVRVELRGIAGKAFVDSGVGAGDEVRICLKQVMWYPAPAQPRPAGTPLEWQMQFADRLLLEYRKNDPPAVGVIDVAGQLERVPESVGEMVVEGEGETPPPVQLPASNGLASVEPIQEALTPLHPIKRRADPSFDVDEYASPAFIKRARVSYGSLFEGGLDILDKEAAMKRKRKRRSRFSMQNAIWRYSSRSPSPEERPRSADSEPSDESETAEIPLPQPSTTTPSKLPMVDESSQTQDPAFNPSPSVDISTETYHTMPTVQSTPTPAYQPRPSDGSRFGEQHVSAKNLFGETHSHHPPLEPFNLHEQNTSSTMSDTFGFQLPDSSRNLVQSSTFDVTSVAGSNPFSLGMEQVVETASRPDGIFQYTETAPELMGADQGRQASNIQVQDNLSLLEGAQGTDINTTHSPPVSEAAAHAEKYTVHILDSPSPPRVTETSGEDRSYGENRVVETHGDTLSDSAQNVSLSETRLRDETRTSGEGEEDEEEADDPSIGEEETAADESITDAPKGHGQNNAEVIESEDDREYDAHYDTGSHPIRDDQRSSNESDVEDEESVEYDDDDDNQQTDGDELEEDEEDEEEGYSDEEEQSSGGEEIESPRPAPRPSAPTAPVVIDLLSDSEDEQQSHPITAAHPAPDSAQTRDTEKNSQVPNPFVSAQQTAVPTTEPEDAGTEEKLGRRLVMSAENLEDVVDEPHVDDDNDSEVEEEEDEEEHEEQLSGSDEEDEDAMEVVHHPDSVEEASAQDEVHPRDDDAEASVESGKQYPSDQMDVDQDDDFHELPDAEVEDSPENQQENPAITVESDPSSTTGEKDEAKPIDAETAGPSAEQDGLDSSQQKPDEQLTVPDSNPLDADGIGTQSQTQASEDVVPETPMPVAIVVTEDKTSEPQTADDNGDSKGAQDHPETTFIQREETTVQIPTPDESHSPSANAAAQPAEQTEDEEESYDDAVEQQIRSEFMEHPDSSIMEASAISNGKNTEQNAPEETSTMSGVDELTTKGQLADEPDIVIAAQSRRRRSRRNDKSSNGTAEWSEDPSIQLAKSSQPAQAGHKRQASSASSKSIAPARSDHRRKVSSSSAKSPTTTRVTRSQTEASESSPARPKTPSPVPHSPTTPRVTRSQVDTSEHSPAQPRTPQTAPDQDIQSSPATLRITRSRIYQGDPSVQLARSSQPPKVIERAVPPRDNASNDSQASAQADPEGKDARTSPTQAGPVTENESLTDLTQRLVDELAQTLPDCLALKTLRGPRSQIVDVLALCAQTPAPPSRPRSGPRDYMLELLLTDPSLGKSAVRVAQLYRQHKTVLPIVQAGDVVLLRQVHVVSLKGRGFGVRIGDASAWAVFERENKELLPQIKGPPMEVTDEEVRYVEGLRRWKDALEADAEALATLNETCREVLRVGAGESK